MTIYSVWKDDLKIGEGPSKAEALAKIENTRYGKSISDLIEGTPARPSRTAADGTALLLRVLIPVGTSPSPHGGYEEISLEKMEPEFACCTTRPIRLSFAGHGITLADVPATVRAVEAGTTIKTVRPGRPPHTQQVAENSLCVELSLPRNSAVTQLAQRLSGRPIGAELDLREARTGYRTVTSGEFFGQTALRTSFQGVRGIELDAPHGEECSVTVI